MYTTGRASPSVSSKFDTENNPKNNPKKFDQENNPKNNSKKFDSENNHKKHSKTSSGMDQDGQGVEMKKDSQVDQLFSKSLRSFKDELVMTFNLYQ